MEGLVSFTLLHIVMILSIIVILSADVESTNVICPHDLYILAIFLEYGFCGHSTFVLQTVDVYLSLPRLLSCYLRSRCTLNACMCSWRTPCSTKSWSTVDISRISRWTRTSKAKRRPMLWSTCPSSRGLIGLQASHRSVTTVAFSFAVWVWRDCCSRVAMLASVFHS